MKYTITIDGYDRLIYQGGNKVFYMHHIQDVYVKIYGI